MTRLLPKLTALLLLIVGMAMTTAVFAAERHRACVTQHHECGDGPAIAQCCCSMAEPGGEPSVPVEQRIDVRSSAALATPTPAVTPLLIDLPAAVHPVPISPRLCLLDLTTLHSILLI